jgi:xylan 1,4-beta-xylosidase
MSNRSFPNPILPGFHPDPSICRVDDDFYLATSSFEYFPGVPIFHSRDLVHWRQIGNVLDRSSQLKLDVAPSSGGIFAPTLRFHGGLFYLITTNYWGGGNFFVTTADPAGPWSEPVTVDLPGIDPDLCWDDLGHCYSTSSGIVQTGIDTETGSRKSEPVAQWSGTGLQHPEAPHIYRRGKWWYMLIAEGGTERGHCVSIARAQSPTGPFEGCPRNPILSHRSTDRPVQNTGHADLVELSDASWWMVLLGTRPRGMTPMYQVLGRESFLTRVHWDDDDWPVVAPVELQFAPPNLEPHPWSQPPARDDFDAASLAPSWISVRRRRDDDWSLLHRPGWLGLRGSSDSMDGPLPTFIGRRQQHHSCTVSVRVEAGDAREAGLCIRMDDRHHLELFICEGDVVVRYRIGDLEQELARTPVQQATCTLELQIRPPSAKGMGMPPDEITLGVQAADDFHRLATVDGRYLSTEVVSGFTGRVIGMYALEGWAYFDWFEYNPLASDDG